MAQKKTYHSKSRKFAEVLDSGFKIPGTDIRFGIDPLIGLLPGYGDLAGAAFSVYFLFYAAKRGAEPSILLRMFVNIMADLTIGSIPILGDLFDIAWKANIRNARLLEKLEEDAIKLETQSKWRMWLLFSVLMLILLAVIVLIGWAVGEAWDILFG